MQKYYYFSTFTNLNRIYYEKKHPQRHTVSAFVFNNNKSKLIEFEIVSCIVVGDILYHATEYLIVVGQQALLYIISEDVAEQTTEIFMTWITQERTRIGEHSYETAEQTKH